MEYGTGKKIKVAMICGFSNSKLRSHLDLKQNRFLFRKVIKLFGLPARVGEYEDFAPWIDGFIAEFERKENIELHIISGHIGLKTKIKEFNENGVYYHLYDDEFTSFLRIIDNAKIWNNLQNSSRIVNGILKNIQPDIVNVVGLENPSVAIPALHIKNIPVFALCQTVYTNPDRKIYSKPKKLNWDLELMFFNKLKYFGVYSRMHRDLLIKNNPDAVICDFKFLCPVFPEVISLDKKYDFVNFAMSLDFRKGAHDSLRALALVKKRYHAVRLNLVGGCNAENKQELLQLIEELDLQDNVEFTPFFEKQEDLFQHLQKSRFAVLPCKMDVVSGTMMQAMYYGLPLVVYKTTGTPGFNAVKECSLISEIGNIEALAENMLLLLDNPIKAEHLKSNAKEYVLRETDNKVIIDRLIADYEAIIEHYHNNTPIPKDLLFDITKFQIYR